MRIDTLAARQTRHLPILRRERAKRRISLPTDTPWPIDPQFVETFLHHGWEKVEDMYGKRCADRWAKALGKRSLIAMREEYLVGLKEK